MSTKHECERCSGFGYTDDDGEIECQACTGDGVVPNCENCGGPHPRDEAGCLRCGWTREGT